MSNEIATAAPRPNADPRKAGRVLSHLLLAEDDDALVAVRERHCPKSSLDAAQLRRVRDLSQALVAALDGDDAATWRRVEAGWRVIVEGAEARRIIAEVERAEAAEGKVDAAAPAVASATSKSDKPAPEPGTMTAPKPEALSAAMPTLGAATPEVVSTAGDVDERPSQAAARPPSVAPPPLVGTPLAPSPVPFAPAAPFISATPIAPPPHAGASPAFGGSLAPVGSGARLSPWANGAPSEPPRSLAVPFVAPLAVSPPPGATPAPPPSARPDPAIDATGALDVRMLALEPLPFYGALWEPPASGVADMTHLSSRDLDGTAFLSASVVMETPLPFRPPTEPASVAPPPPVQSEARAPVPAAHVALTLEQFAGLCAACAVSPAHARLTEQRYGIATPAARQELDANWRKCFESDPSLYRTFLARYNEYHRWLITRAAPQR